MNLTTSTAMVLAALIASLVLLFQHRERLFPGIATLASGIEALMAFQVLQMRVKNVPLGLILAAALAVAALVVWVRGSGKLVTTAATVASVVGVLQVLSVLRVMR